MKYLSSESLCCICVLSEFDIAALVVSVGAVCSDTHQKKQWVFVTDGSISESQSEQTSNSLLAISFRSPHNECDSFAPINYNLAGSVVSILFHSSVVYCTSPFPSSTYLTL